MNKTINILEWIVDKMTGLGAVCLVGMVVITCVDVVGRFFGHPILGSVEIVGFLSTLAVALSLPYTHQVKGHIGVEILVRLFSERVQTIIELCTNIVAMILFGIVTWRMAVYGKTMQSSGEVSMNLELPEYIIIYMVAFCFLFFGLVILRDILQDIKKLRGNR